MKNDYSVQYLKIKGTTEKNIKEYYKRLKDLRNIVNPSNSNKNHHEFMYELKTGLRFFSQEWPATTKNSVNSPKAIIIALHDAYECSDIFFTVADSLNSFGIMLISMDYRGHGRTGGQVGRLLGDLSSFNDIYEDISHLIFDYQLKYDCPIYLLGYGIGALIAIQIVHKYKISNIKGLILISPIFKLKDNSKQLLLYPFITMGDIFTQKKINQRIYPEKIEKTYYLEYTDYVRNNPFRLKMMSLRMLKKLLNIIIKTPRIARKVNYPCLILQGTKDHLVNHYSTEKIYKNWVNKNKFIRFYEEGGHNLFMDKYTNDIYEEIIKFMNFKG